MNSAPPEPTADETAYRTAGELLTMLRARVMRCRELLDLHIDRVERLNPVVNAVVALDADRARAVAKSTGGFRPPPGY